MRPMILGTFGPASNVLWYHGQSCVLDQCKNVEQNQSPYKQGKMAYQNKVLVSDDPQVLSMYDFRTAKEYAAYLIPHLKPDFHILDIGSGPGGITRDLAQLVPQGKVIGLDISPGVVAQAKAKYQEPNLSFDVGDASDLSRFADNTL